MSRPKFRLKQIIQVFRGHFPLSAHLTQGESPDPILQQFRFCNVRREDDRVTKWLSEHWREPYHDSPNLTIAMVLARMINWPPTLDAIGFPVWWDSAYKQRVLTTMAERKERGEKVWSSAYIVTTCGARMDKALYVVETVCGAVAKGNVAPKHGDTLHAFWTRLRGVPGLGAGFIAAQVVADLKNTFNNPLMEAEDWWDWAAPGPGSIRGLNRFFKLPLSTSPGNQWLMRMRTMRDKVSPKIPTYLKDTMSMQDWQNVMCEWDKYERTRHGEGRPRQNYTPAD